MKRLTVVLISLSLAGILALSIGLSEDKTTGVKSQVAERERPAAFEGRIGMFGVIDMSKKGQEVASVEDACRQVGHKVRLADEKIAGHPGIRVDGEETILIYPNDVEVFVYKFPWPDRAPQEYYQQYVADNNRTAKNSSDPTATWELHDIVGNPGYVIEAGANNIGGQKIPRTGSIVWHQDGLEYNVSGPINKAVPLSRLLPIAESIANTASP